MSDENQPSKPNVSFSMGGSMSGGTMSGGVSYDAPGAPPPAATPGGSVKDVTTQSFVADVIEASRNGPVVVDFWAPWCGPCKQLGPIIEKVVAEAKGAVTLCKMDIEKYPDVAGQMGIQSIPAVVAFVDGRPADAFMGAKPEQEVRAFIDKLAAANPTPEMADMSAALEEADRLAGEKDYAGAADLYGGVLAREPGNLDALTGLGQCYLAVGETAQAQALVDSVPPEHHEKPPLQSLVKALQLAAQADELGDVSTLAAASQADPKNHQARFDYAVALAAHGKKEEAVEQLIEIVKVDRTWNEDGARAQLVEFFEAWGNADPATVSGRRQLSSVLFS